MAEPNHLHTFGQNKSFKASPFLYMAPENLIIKIADCRYHIDIPEDSIIKPYFKGDWECLRRNINEIESVKYTLDKNKAY